MLQRVAFVSDDVTCKCSLPLASKGWLRQEHSSDTLLLLFTNQVGSSKERKGLKLLHGEVEALLFAVRTAKATYKDHRLD